ncbi:MAG: hypothetical protein DMG79_20275 [Acidobacteria bacterium]|nr:MAG: hypothetical protein DMG79_20275 [Acidobacteriota bacterium]
MAKKKPVQKRANTFETWLKDYPESMSGYERESRAAEAMLASDARKRKQDSGKPKNPKPR